MKVTGKIKWDDLFSHNFFPHKKKHDILLFTTVRCNFKLQKFLFDSKLRNIIIMRTHKRTQWDIYSIYLYHNIRKNNFNQNIIVNLKLSNYWHKKFISNLDLIHIVSINSSMMIIHYANYSIWKNLYSWNLKLLF